MNCQQTAVNGQIVEQRYGATEANTHKYCGKNQQRHYFLCVVKGECYGKTDEGKHQSVFCRDSLHYLRHYASRDDSNERYKCEKVACKRSLLANEIRSFLVDYLSCEERRDKDTKRSIF